MNNIETNTTENTIKQTATRYEEAKGTGLSSSLIFTVIFVIAMVILSHFIN